MNSTPPSLDALALIQEAFQDSNNLVELTHYALRELRQKYWRGLWSGYKPIVTDAEEVVHAAFSKLMTGTRSWDHERHPDLISHLKSIIDSDVNHMVARSEYSRLERLTPYLGETDEECMDRISADSMANDEQLNHDWYFQLLGACESDALAHQMLETIFMDPSLKRTELAEALGVSVKEITNAHKRIDRKAAELNLSRQTILTSNAP